jgi:hypothetical protein
MAKIEMDISEYKEMEKNARLLEKALEREQEQQFKIEALTLEKMKALEDASKSVSYITKINTQQVLLKKRPPRDILDHLEHYMQVEYRGGRYEPFRRFESMGRDRLCDELDNISKAFFDIQTLHNEKTETVVVKGLDETIAKIKIQEEAKLIKKYKSELARLEYIEGRLEELKLSLATLNADLIKSAADNELLAAENLEHAELIEAWEESEKEFKKLIKEPHNIFNASKKLSRIKSLV